MLAHIKRAIGYITVRERDGIITVSGIPSTTITSDIKKQWQTSRINSQLFIRIDRSEITLPSFFAVEFELIVARLLASPAVRTNKRALRQILFELQEQTWLKQVTRDHPPVLDLSCLSEIKFDLLEHQKAFLDKYNYLKPRYGLKGCLLMVPPGGGKTISDISVAVCARAERVIIVSPKNAVYDVWRKTLLNDMTVPQRVWVAADDKPLDLNARWFVFHYESLERAIALAQQSTGMRITIILDESHSFNDIKSLRTERFLDLCTIAKPTDIIWASGTPIKALGSEAIPLIRSIDPLFTPDVEIRFRKMFGQDASKANEILNYRLGLISFKVPKATFMSDKPIMEDRYIKMPNGNEFTLPFLKDLMSDFIRTRLDYYNRLKPEILRFYYGCLKEDYEPTIRGEQETRAYRQYRTYISIFTTKGFDARTMMDEAKYCNQYERKIIIPRLPVDKQKQFKEYRTVVKYVELKVRGECLGRILSKERERCHVEMIKHIDLSTVIDNSLKKTLIFTSYVQVVDACASKLREEGYQPLKVYGDTNSQLPAIVKEYRELVDANPLIATYQSLSSAVPLTNANTVVFLNSPFRYHEQEQAISRCSRIGQDTQVYGIRFFLDTDGIPNISTRSEDIFEWSKMQVNQILGTDLPEDNNLGLESLSIYLPKDYFTKPPAIPFHPSASW